jgi:chromate transporter
LAKLFRAFLRLGLTAFGGPAMLAHLKEVAVKRHGWLEEKSFSDGVVLCQSIPGATAMQMAAYIGLKTRGVAGALVAYIGFGLPAFLFMLLLSILYAGSHQLPLVVLLFSGLQVIVVAIVAYAAYAFSKTGIRDYRAALFAVVAALAFWQGVSPFIVIMGAGLGGALFYKTPATGPSANLPKQDSRLIMRQVLLLWAIFLTSLVGLYFFDASLSRLAVLMLKIDLFAFGGGFASVPLMLHEIVEVRGWLDSRTFMDGIALGQVTPGPVVITATFVGYLLKGLGGALVATIAIFAPSFLLLTGTAPVFDKLKASRYFFGITKGILASFVGLLFFVTWLFAFLVPWDLVRALLVAAALLALVKKLDILYVVLIGAAISLALL